MSILALLVSELEKTGNKKVGFIFCVCTGKCPGFSKMDMWDFINIIRAEYPVEYAFIHPMLCDEDGERFLAEFLKKDRKYLVAGCAPIMQRKLFKELAKTLGTDVVPQREKTFLDKLKDVFSF